MRVGHRGWVGASAVRGECGHAHGGGGSHTVRQTISNLPSNDEDERDDGAEQVGVKEDAGGTAGTRRGTIAGEA